MPLIKKCYQRLGCSAPHTPWLIGPFSCANRSLFFTTTIALFLAGCHSGLELGSDNSPPEFGTVDELIAEENNVLVGSVSAEDPDGDRLSYSVLGSDGASFEIEAGTGLLSFRAPPDYENPEDVDGDNTYEVIVRASDDRQSSDIAIKVILKNKEELNVGPFLPLTIAEQDYQNFGAVDPSMIEIEELFSAPDRLWSVKIFDSRLAIASSVNGFFYAHNLQTAVTTELDLNSMLLLFNDGQGGIFDFELVPQLGQGPRLYFTASIAKDAGSALSIHSVLLDTSGDTPAIRDYRKHLELPSTDSLYHFGGAIKIVDRVVYVSHGDRLERDKAQSSRDYNGKILRLVIDDNGDLAAHPDNDYLSALPLVFSKGHRNPQGMEWIDFNQMLISTEHGPQGGDEVNVLLEGTNYGWPKATFGEEYGGGTIGETQVAGMQDAVTFYLPSIAPRAIRYVGASQTFPSMDNSLLIASLKFERIVSLRLDSARPMQSFIDLSGQGRISGLDLNEQGEIFVATHSIPGRVLKISGEQR